MSTQYGTVDLELIEYVRDQDELDAVNALGIIKPNTVLLNGRHLRIPVEQSITVDSVEVPGHDVARGTLTVFVRKVNIEARVRPEAE
ncbi:hypothetical protein [Rhodococcus sp. (in: high G+C Gram-positive bacteria)]|uniref:hypothetical protein n=1 Tax=Rhodococcus sp. TaxID=1831 RepID=UPI00257DD4C8|nr:hypothetical protein [Rhodococcus sp. (in: high G+C Gram-positive bacteria)]MBQ7806356.1 hypothetical protein [Rhodococcus sp. (in: high G+C Gram-positive bacteria)]